MIAAISVYIGIGLGLFVWAIYPLSRTKYAFQESVRGFCLAFFGVVALWPLVFYLAWDQTRTPGTANRKK